MQIIFLYQFWFGFRLTFPLQAALGTLYRELRNTKFDWSAHAEFKTILKQSLETTKMRMAIRQQLAKHEIFGNYSYEYVCHY